MIDREHNLPVTRQAKALNLARSTVYYLPRPLSVADLVDAAARRVFPSAPPLYASRADRAPAGRRTLP